MCRKDRVMRRCSAWPHLLRRPVLHDRQSQHRTSRSFVLVCIMLVSETIRPALVGLIHHYTNQAMLI